MNRLICPESEREIFDWLHDGAVFECETPAERNALFRFFKRHGYELDSWCEEHSKNDDGDDEDNCKYLNPFFAGEYICCYGKMGIEREDHDIIWFDQIRHLVDPDGMPDSDVCDMTDEEFGAAFADLFGGVIAV